MAALTGTLGVRDVWGTHFITSYAISIAADNDTFDSGLGGRVVDWWITSKTDNLADGPVVDDETSGVFTFGATAAASITLWIVHK